MPRLLSPIPSGFRQGLGMARFISLPGTSCGNILYPIEYLGMIRILDIRTSVCTSMRCSRPLGGETQGRANQINHYIPEPRAKKPRPKHPIPWLPSTCQPHATQSPSYIPCTCQPHTRTLLHVSTLHPHTASAVPTCHSHAKQTSPILQPHTRHPFIIVSDPATHCHHRHHLPSSQHLIIPRGPP